MHEAYLPIVTDPPARHFSFGGLLRPPALVDPAAVLPEHPVHSVFFVPKSQIRFDEAESCRGGLQTRALSTKLSLAKSTASKPFQFLR